MLPGVVRFVVVVVVSFSLLLSVFFCFLCLIVLRKGDA